ncbi:SET domain-containing protein-lysine N-methyltransferase [Luteolibacter ambystomatis]|uniref:SET domain-containing protein-lysine N-methyltransferase n=1 Tax=Luteolibacter ambystomatis TaxID=2824561 RepID=A0A975G6F7_9BACT|nr:SET domain-containing protein-lysine N-methyltransferase [Luteolibacter ambystomatis]QUE49658.1 SET domain-containing protein-lysine N-methyltransferase [Luteolibacter ambystomatis]
MAKKAAKNKQAQDAWLRKKLTELWNRGQSEYCEVRGSVIHGRGVYATQFIPKETKIIEYVGELVDKEESDKRAHAQHAKAIETGDAAVYIFTLSKRWDIDGNVPWNTARLINHSCNPNCEAWIEGRKIFIHSLREIKEGEELTFDYGFDVDCYEDHPCLCGSENCVGYIVSRDQWPELRQRLGGAEE